MKGNKKKPKCGYSSGVVDILVKLNVKFLDIDVLKDKNLNEGIKIFSDWPTFPQLYVNRKFIGGFDIVNNLYKNNKLKDILV